MRIKAFVMLLCLSLLLPLAAVADSHEKPPNIASVWTMTPKANADDFEAKLKAHGDWRAENGDPRSWQIFTVEAGDDMRNYYVRYCCFHWADQDAYLQWTAESGAVEAFNEQVGGMVESMTHHFQDVDTVNSNWPAEVGNPALIAVTTWTPNPAKAVQMGATMSRLSALAKEHGWPYHWGWYRTLGGEANLSVAVPYDNYAAMAPPEQTFYAFLSAQLGAEEAAALMGQFNESFWTSEYTIYRFRPDLSMSSDD